MLRTLATRSFTTLKPVDINQILTRNITNIVCTLCLKTITTPTQQSYFLNHQITRYKSKGNKKSKSNREESEDSDEPEPEPFDDVVDKFSKIVQTSVSSMRADLILKAGLGIARNKIDVLFYESKLRLNGQKILKKSVTVYEGDELDVVRGVSSTNPEFLNVSRVEIINADVKGESIRVRLRRCKSLTVDNYEDAWKPTTEQ